MVAGWSSSRLRQQLVKLGNFDAASALAQVGPVPAHLALAFQHDPIGQPIVRMTSLARPRLPEFKAGLA